MIDTHLLLWGGLFAVLALSIATDVVVHRRANFPMTLREGLLETAAWVALALLFDLGIFFARGRTASVQFLTGYLVEQTLSVDNVFLFLVIFRSFDVGTKAQHRVLYYGVAGALAMRIAFVSAGVALLDRFDWIAYVFGAILFFTAMRMLFSTREEKSGPAWIVRLAGRFFPVTEKGDDKHFFLRVEGRWMATSLFLALLTIEVMDVAFAVDSIPAVLAITRDTFIAYSSNVFAVLGLRAIYFVLASVLQRVRFLHQGLAAVLIFTGFKMVAAKWLDIPDLAGLAVVAAIFGATLGASAIWPSQSLKR